MLIVLSAVNVGADFVLFAQAGWWHPDIPILIFAGIDILGPLAALAALVLHRRLTGGAGRASRSPSTASRSS